MKINRGIQNIGNTCYLNSVIQCITHLFIFDKDIPSNEFYRLWIDLHNTISYDNNTPINIHKFINSFIKSITDEYFFDGFQQNDVSEFISLLFQLLHTSIKEERDMVIEGIPQNEYDSIAIQCMHLWKKHFELSYSYIIEKTYSQLYTITKCPDCNYVTYNYDPIQIIPLSIISRNIYHNSLYNCLDAFIGVESLDNQNQWRCDKCNNKVNSIQNNKFWNLSDVLIFQLKIYTNNNKIDHYINYPDILDMDPYNINYNEGSNKYKLIAMCIQFGSMNGGHYIAICYNQYDHQWRIYNDDQVSIISINNAMKQKPYCLFYKQIN